jgi:hypothetical protein
MKRLWVMSIAIVLWFLSPALAGDELAWEKKLPFKTATIHYSIKGIEDGTETLYIRDSGRERATYRETVSNMMGMKTTNKTVVLKTPDLIYSYDLEKQQGFKGVNPQKYMIEEYNRLSAKDKEKVRENAKKMGAAYAEGMGGEIQQNAAQFLGFDCDKVEIMGGSSTYLIHGTDVALKTEMNMVGMKLTMVAESVDQGKVDDKFFRHPVGITAEADSQSDEMARNMARQAIAMLQDPDSIKNMPILPQGAVPGGQPEMSDEEREVMQQVQEMMKGMKGKSVQ